MTERDRARRLPVDHALHRTSAARHRLPSVLRTWHLVLLGMGVMVGGGIYTLAGQEAATTAGPAVIVSFGVGAVVCLLAGLCYAELGASIPVAGSVYTFTYVAFGEVLGWLVGWALVLELVMAAAVVSRVLSQYVVSTLAEAGVELPSGVTDLAGFTGWNLWAPAVVLLLALMIGAGLRLTRRTVSTLVVVKTVIVFVLLLVGLRYAEPANYTPFVPDPVEADSTSVLASLSGFGDSAFGIAGIMLAVGPVVFAYVGFDLISTSAEDARDPRRSIPRAILISLGLVTALYLAMAVVLVGLRPHTELGTDAPFVDALAAAGVGSWATVTVGLGAVIGSLTVVIVVLTALSRVLFSIGRDGLLPRALGTVSPRWNTPATACGVGGVAAVALAAYPRVLELADTLVLAALFTFYFCALAVLAVRRRLPDLERGFRIPGGPVVPILAALAVAYLSLTFPPRVWLMFLGWLLLGVLVYLVWGRRHSRLATGEGPDEPSGDEHPAAAPATAPAHTAVGRHRR